MAVQPDGHFCFTDQWKHMPTSVCHNDVTFPITKLLFLNSLRLIKMLLHICALNKKQIVSNDFYHV